MKKIILIGLILGFSIAHAADENGRTEEILPAGSCVAYLDSQKEISCENGGQPLMDWWTNCQFTGDLKLASGEVITKTFEYEASANYHSSCGNECRFWTLGTGALFDQVAVSRKVEKRAKDRI